MLSVCATPIGNLEDVTLRVLDELRSADVVLCEDTRRTRILLDRHGISARLLSYQRHNEAARTADMLPRLAGGRAGRPRQRRGAAGRERSRRAVDRGRDRGGRAGDGAAGPVRRRDCARRERPRRRAVPVPRLSAARRLRTGSLGEELAASPHAAIAFESPQRIVESLERLAPALGERHVAVCRELTKKFEEVVRGTSASVAAQLRQPVKGEITLVVGPAERAVKPEEPSLAASAVAELVAAGVGRRAAADLVARLTGISRNTLYRGSL